jgi:hypothetical protein
LTIVIGFAFSALLDEGWFFRSCNEHYIIRKNCSRSFIYWISMGPREDPFWSSHQRGGLTPRCWLISSSGWKMSRGFGWARTKAILELGLQRRETQSGSYQSPQPLAPKGSVADERNKQRSRVDQLGIAGLTECFFSLNMLFITQRDIGRIHSETREELK